MNAIVEQNEKANQETSCHDRERQCPPIGKIVPDREDHQVPQSSIRDHRIGELPNRLAATGITIGRECRARVRDAEKDFTLGDTAMAKHKPFQFLCYALCARWKNAV